ncbi:SGNH/GDSL hydrolase family protein [Herbiconiux sp. 11R-BC]|uniref:SGNH/GDSL hydrolase family protein n=1 Tax=Herbiconiux sp. 11R-BC TaxID=3111637 RepID=UPI003C0BF016
MRPPPETALGSVPGKAAIVAHMGTGRVGVIAAVVAVGAIASVVGVSVLILQTSGVSSAASVSAASPPGRPVAPPQTAEPAGTSAAAEDAVTPVAAAQVIVTIGDSIMAGYGLDDPSQAWPALVGASTGATVVNLGCSGGGFIAEGDCGGDFESLIPSAVAANPDVVIIQSSDNDLGFDPAEVQDATQQTVEELRGALPHAQIVAFTTLWDQPDPAPDDILTGSAALQDAVASVGGISLDLGQPIAGQPGLLQDDDEHPTPDGQHVLADVIQTALTGAGIPL